MSIPCDGCAITVDESGNVRHDATCLREEIRSLTAQLAEQSELAERLDDQVQELTAQLGAAQEALAASLDEMRSWLGPTTWENSPAIRRLRNALSPARVAWMEATIAAAEEYLKREPWAIRSVAEGIAVRYRAAKRAVEW